MVGNGFSGEPKGVFVSRRGVDVQKYSESEEEISRNGFSEDERVVRVVVVFRKSSAAASRVKRNGFSLKTGFSTLAAGPENAVLFSLWYFFNIVFNVYNKSAR